MRLEALRATITAVWLLTSVGDQHEVGAIDLPLHHLDAAAVHVAAVEVEVVSKLLRDLRERPFVAFDAADEGDAHWGTPLSVQPGHPALHLLERTNPGTLFQPMTHQVDEDVFGLMEVILVS
jgi:hypothetical protein